MKRRRILIVVIPVIVCGAAWLLIHPRVPSYQGKPLSVWIERYRNPGGFGNDAQADEAVRQMGVAVIPELLRMLRSSDTDLKFKLAKIALKFHFHKTPPESAGDQHIKAAMAFWALGPVASNALPELIEIYEQSSSSDSQTYVASVFSSIGPAARPAIPALLHGLSNSNNRVRLTTIVTLGRIHAEPQTVVPALIKSLGDPDYGPRISAARSLGQFGTDARPAVPDLKATFMDANMIIIAAGALKLIAPEVYAQPETLLPGVINCLTTRDSMLQVWVSDMLFNYGTNARPALDSLAPLLVSGNSAVRIMAGRAAKKISPDIRAEAEPTAIALGRQLRDPDARVRMIAAYALGLIGPEAKAAIPDLIPAVSDSDDLTRYYVEAALKELDPAALAKAKADLEKANNAPK